MSFERPEYVKGIRVDGRLGLFIGVSEEFVTAAMAISEDSDCHNKHGAVIARKHRALAVAANKKKTHPAVPRQKSYHAEAVALLRLKNGEAEGATLYSFRNGLQKKSRPCSDCLLMARLHGIRFIVYTEMTGRVVVEKL
jgi:deoxycytidylate deaminase